MPAPKQQPRKYIELKVAEAILDDVNRGICRADSTFLKELDIRPGDVIAIEGERQTVAVVDRAYPGDIGLNIIRMDGIIRRNARTGIGETVKLSKADVKEAKKIIIAPAKKGVHVDIPTEIFRHALQGRPVMKGDIIALGVTRRRKQPQPNQESPTFEDIFSLLDNRLPGFGFGDLKFIIADTMPKQAVVVTELSEVNLNPDAVEIQEKTQVVEVAYEDIGGLNDEIKKIREMVELPLKHPEIFERLGIEPPKGVLLHGAPGTGKTLLAKAVANETNANFLLINGPEIISKFYGESEQNLRKKFEEAEKDAPSIIFIDEIDAIAPKREEMHGEVEKRVVAQLLALMDGLKSRGKVVVIAATNIPNSLDPALRRPGRFDREIEIGAPNRDARLQILKIHTRQMPLGKDVCLDDIADITHGFVGADLSALSKEAAMMLLRRIFPDLKLQEEQPIPKEVLEKMIITQKDFKEALRVVRPSAMREVLVEVPNVKWDDVGGLLGVKQELKEAVEWPLKNPKAFKRLGVRPPRGILLYGAPGTGKTLLAKAVATESNANFIYVKGPELLSMWVGQSEKGIRSVFHRARQTAPAIIFFDEIDALAPKRSMMSTTHVTETVVNQLLTEMDGLEDLNDVVIIAATNRPDIMDNALLRPGRFDRLIYVGVPDGVTRAEIFRVHTKHMPIGKEKEAMIKSLASKTEGYAGADIEAVCREAAIFALRENIESKQVKEEHFEQAILKVKPSITKEIEEAYSQFLDIFRKSRAKEIKEEKPSYYG